MTKVKSELKFYPSPGDGKGLKNGKKESEKAIDYDKFIVPVAIEGKKKSS